MEKRVYTIEDAKKFAVTMFNAMIPDEQVIPMDDVFNAFGEPYEPATPPATVAPPMCDEDKVWMAACSISTGSRLLSKLNIETAFDMLDEFRRQQKKREGKK